MKRKSGIAVPLTALALAAVLTVCTSAFARTWTGTVTIPSAFDTLTHQANNEIASPIGTVVHPDHIEIGSSGSVSYRLDATSDMICRISVEAYVNASSALTVEMNGSTAGTINVTSAMYQSAGNVQIRLAPGSNTLTFKVRSGGPVYIMSFAVKYESTVESATVNLTSTKATSVYNESVTFNITASLSSGTPYSGKVRFAVDSSETELTMSDGQLTHTTSAIPAGVHSVKVIVPASGSLIQSTSNTVSLTVRKAQAVLPPTLPKGLKGVYGNKLSTVTLPSGYRWVKDTTVMDKTPAPAVSYDAYYNTDTANYEDAKATISLEVTKRPVTITAQDKKKTSDKPMPELTWKVTSGDIIQGDELDIKLKCDMTGTGSTFRIVVDDPVMLENAKYSITFKEGKLTIEDSAALKDFKKHVTDLKVPAEPGADASEMAVTIYGKLNALGADDQASLPADITSKITSVQNLAGEFNHRTAYGSLTGGTLPWFVRIEVTRMDAQEASSQSGLKNVAAAYSVSLTNVISGAPYLEQVNFTLSLESPEPASSKPYLVSRVAAEPVRLSDNAKFSNGAVDFPITGTGSYVLHTDSSGIGDFITSHLYLILGVVLGLGLAVAAALTIPRIIRKRRAFAVPFSSAKTGRAKSRKKDDYDDYDEYEYDEYDDYDDGYDDEYGDYATQTAGAGQAADEYEEYEEYDDYDEYAENTSPARAETTSASVDPSGWLQSDNAPGRQNTSPSGRTNRASFQPGPDDETAQTVASSPKRRPLKNRSRDDDGFDQDKFDKEFEKLFG